MIEFQTVMVCGAWNELRWLALPVGQERLTLEAQVSPGVFVEHDYEVKVKHGREAFAVPVGREKWKALPR